MGAPVIFKGEFAALLNSGGIEYKDGRTIEFFNGNPNGALSRIRGSICFDRQGLKLYMCSGGDVWVPHDQGLTDFYTNTKQYTGFLNPGAVTVTYSSASRTITLTGTVTAYYEGQQVAELISGWESPAHPDTDGQYFLIYNGASFQWITGYPQFTQLLIAYVHYRSSGVSFAIRECHGIMQPESHSALHATVGTYRQSGGDISGVVLNSTTPSNRRPLIGTTHLVDEDLPSILPALSSASYTVCYLTGAGEPTFLTDQPDILPLNGDQPYYNSFSGGNWGLTLLSNNSHTSVWLCAIPATADSGSQAIRYFFLLGQSATNLVGQQSLQPANINFGQLSALIPEFVVIQRFIIQYTGGNWRIVQNDRITGTRFSQISSLSGTFLTGVTTTDELDGAGTPASPLGLTGLIRSPSLVHMFSDATSSTSLEVQELLGYKLYYLWHNKENNNYVAAFNSDSAIINTGSFTAGKQDAMLSIQDTSSGPVFNLGANTTNQVSGKATYNYNSLHRSQEHVYTSSSSGATVVNTYTAATNTMAVTYTPASGTFSITRPSASYSEVFTCSQSGTTFSFVGNYIQNSYGIYIQFADPQNFRFSGMALTSDGSTFLRSVTVSPLHHTGHVLGGGSYYNNGFALRHVVTPMGFPAEPPTYYDVLTSYSGAITAQTMAYHTSTPVSSPEFIFRSMSTDAVAQIENRLDNQPVLRLRTSASGKEAVFYATRAQFSDNTGETGTYSASGATVTKNSDSAVFNTTEIRCVQVDPNTLLWRNFFAARNEAVGSFPPGLYYTNGDGNVSFAVNASSRVLSANGVTAEFYSRGIVSGTPSNTREVLVETATSDYAIWIANSGSNKMFRLYSGTSDYVTRVDTDSYTIQSSNTPTTFSKLDSSKVTVATSTSTAELTNTAFTITPSTGTKRFVADTGTSPRLLFVGDTANKEVSYDGSSALFKVNGSITFTTLNRLTNSDGTDNLSIYCRCNSTTYPIDVEDITSNNMFRFRKYHNLYPLSATFDFTNGLYCLQESGATYSRYFQLNKDALTLYNASDDNVVFGHGGVVAAKPSMWGGELAFTANNRGMVLKSDYNLYHRTANGDRRLANVSDVVVQSFLFG